jgi:hypothetical protein
MMPPTMKEGALVRWRRRAIAAKKLADRFQTPFAKRGMMQVVATYKWLAKRAAKRKRAELRVPRLGGTASRVDSSALSACGREMPPVI